MIEARRVLGLVLCTGLGAFGCVQGEGDPAVEVGVAREALNTCNETVPATRSIDGIPAYAQCAAVMSSAIYSNNGVDTATMSMGSDWVRTQYSGGYQCTELAHRYLHFKWNVKWIPNGNAGKWCDTQPPANSGVVQTMTPVHGDIMVLAPGSCGADGTTGHVTVVDIVDTAKQKLTVVEQNGARRGTYNQSCAKCFLHVVANDGMNAGQPITAPVPTGAAGSSAAAGAQAPSPPADDPAKRPAPRAGSAAPPPPSSPAGAPAPATPIVAPAAPAAAGSPAPAPAAAPTPAPKAGSAAPPTPITTPATSREEASDSGCSVTQVRGSENAPWFFALALSLITVRLRRRRRA